MGWRDNVCAECGFYGNCVGAWIETIVTTILMAFRFLVFEKTVLHSSSHKNQKPVCIVQPFLPKIHLGLILKLFNKNLKEKKNDEKNDFSFIH